MYSKDMLIGIILSSFNFHIDISVDESRNIGYRTRIFAKVYGSREFMEAVDRTLQQHGIYSKRSLSYSHENTRRNTYSLSISKIDLLSKLISLIPNIPNKNNDLELTREAISLVSRKAHLTWDGLQRLIIIKEMKTNGFNDYE